MYKILLYITMVFLILQDCSIKIGNQMLYIAPIFIILSLVIYLIIKPNRFATQMYYAFIDTPFKYLIYFIIFLFATAGFHGGFTVALKIIAKIILIFCLTVIPSVIFPILIFPNVLSYAKMLKFFVYSCLFILLYGILDYLFIILFGIKAPLYGLFCSRQLITNNLYQTACIILKRASSVFFEPSFFATFIFLFLPMSYILCKSNNKIFKNAYADYISKVSIVVLFWLCLISTKSPIYILFCLIFTIIFYSKFIIKIIKKQFIFLLILITSFSLSALPFLVFNQKFSGNDIIISRIIKVCNAFGNLDLLVQKEGSFATRIITTANTYQAAKKVPLLGCGFGNTYGIMRAQYSKTTTPLTEEIYKVMIQNDKYDASPNIFWSMLLQGGIIGIILLYTFLFRSIYIAFKIKKYFIDKSRLLLESTIFVAINYIVISFYWSIITYPMMWFIFGILNSYILTYKLQLKKLKHIKGVYNE